jgi:signal transduction histidine kinase
MTSIVLLASLVLLILLVLFERRGRIRAERAVADQLAYESMIAKLTTDAVRHAYDAPRALEDALGRIGVYANASTVIFRHAGETEERRSLAWRSPDPLPGQRTVQLEVPLIINGKPTGILQLHRNAEGGGWPTQLAARIVAAGEIIASAVARGESAQAVRAGEALNSAVLASLATEIAILDQHGVIIRVNDAWLDLARRGLKQYEHNGFVGHNYLAECQRAAERDCEEARDVKNGIEAVLARKAQRFTFEYHTSQPEDRWYLLTVDRLEHEDGGAVVSHVDISDRRNAERDAAETRRKIAHMGRVVLIGEMAAAVSHELSQPLAAIRANAEAGVLLSGRPQASNYDAKEIFEDIRAAGQRATQVVEHIRMLLRDQPPEVTAVDVNEVCRSAVQLIKRDAALRRTKVELDLDEYAAAVMGDSVQLQQVVLNLVLNALDAMMTSEREREVKVGTCVASEEVEIYVADTGDGLPADVQSHLFESFFSTKPKGLGLGLVIVRSIVERHEGRIRAENGSGGGAVFRIFLPLATAAHRNDDGRHGVLAEKRGALDVEQLL